MARNNNKTKQNKRVCRRCTASAKSRNLDLSQWYNLLPELLCSFIKYKKINFNVRTLTGKYNSNAPDKMASSRMRPDVRMVWKRNDKQTINQSITQSISLWQEVGDLFPSHPESRMTANANDTLQTKTNTLYIFHGSTFWVELINHFTLKKIYFMSLC